MANIDTDYLNSLVTRFKAYKKPNDTQKLIIALGELQERSDDDDKKLSVLLRAEKKADELVKARAATQRIMNAEKAAARKLDTRKKVIWGAALKAGAKNDAQIAQLMRKLYNEGYVAEKDKDAVRADYKALTTSNNLSF
ncbi:hypothetical protein [Psychrobacter communis]|uniref:Mobilization protein MobC n=1 Tax=Psychrobacter communis TaxID=2762238 RepID=A0ABR8RLS0_9GAMM|nr:hypothetical protein [Psychrobacter communis]MBD7948750.1 hypothetical protein [Psychrobacter communis]